MTNIAGIDLGTTFSALAVLNGIGRPEIVPNADGERLTPSAIYFDEEEGQVIRVGCEALNCRYLNAERSVRWVKRHIGDSSYRINIGGRQWTAEELSSLILKKLRQDCSTQVGQITDAVITVPAHFDEVRRKATMEAGSMAGLNVIGIVNEPVAAALYYATSREVTGKVMAYDLGGGTFDVTTMDIKGRRMEIVCSQGVDADLLRRDFSHHFSASLAFGSLRAGDPVTPVVPRRACLLLVIPRSRRRRRSRRFGRPRGSRSAAPCPSRPA